MLVSNLIRQLKVAGVWTLLDRLWLFAAEDAAQALTDLVARSAATAVNSPTFTANRGYAGNGTTSYVNSNFTPSTDGVQYVRDSASAFTYQNTDRVAGAIDSLGVANAGGVQTVVSPRYTGDIAGGNVNNTAAAGSATGAVTDALGLVTMSRTSSTALAAYKRATLLGAASVASSAVQNVAVAFLGLNNNGAFTQGETARVALAGMGGGLTAGQVTSLNTALEAYLTAIGGNA